MSAYVCVCLCMHEFVCSSSLYIPDDLLFTIKVDCMVLRRRYAGKDGIVEITSNWFPSGWFDAKFENASQ